MRYPSWHIGTIDPVVEKTLSDAGYTHLVSSVLSVRGITTAKEAEAFFSMDEALPLQYMDCKDMSQAVACIQKALHEGQKIAVYGDYDVDGISATCLLTDYLSEQGADCLWYIPRRIEDGYGLNKEALQQLKDQGVSLVITVDCGITGVEEALFAKEIGLQLVITDHHECKEILPDAVAVINPHRPDCTYPFKNLAGVGVALKLALAMSPKEKRPEVLKRYAPLAAVGTIADVMQMTGENRTLVTLGIRYMKDSRWVGIHALLKECNIELQGLSSVQIGFSLAPRINAAGRMGQAEIAAELFLTKDPVRAELLAKSLCDLNRQRQLIEQDIFAEAEKEFLATPEENRYAIVLSSKTWHQGVVGIVASRLSEKYACPCFMIHLADGKGKGSCRSFGGMNLFTALEYCSDLLESFGGHELAAGFTILEENIPAFQDKMNQYVKEYQVDNQVENQLEVDALITQVQWVSLREVMSLSLLEPYGNGNAEPTFCFQGAIVETMQNIGQNRHMKMRISKGGLNFECVFFSVTMETCDVEIGDRVDLVFHVHINDFHGNKSVQLQLMDLRPSEVPSIKEEENETLYQHFMSKEVITAYEAHRMLPSRQQFERLWRTMKGIAINNIICESKYPLLRKLALGVAGNEHGLRVYICLAVFSRVGLIDVSVDANNMCTIRLIEEGKKVDLEETSIMKALRRVSAIEEGEDDDLNGTI